MHFRWCTAKRCAIKMKFYFHSWHKHLAHGSRGGDFPFVCFEFWYFSFCFSPFLSLRHFYLIQYDDSQAHTHAHTEQTRVGNTVNTGIKIAFFSSNKAAMRLPNYIHLIQILTVHSITLKLCSRHTKPHLISLVFFSLSFFVNKHKHM